jgi:hypothetical protein
MTLLTALLLEYEISWPAYIKNLAGKFNDPRKRLTDHEEEMLEDFLKKNVDEKTLKLFRDMGLMKRHVVFAK